MSRLLFLAVITTSMLLLAGCSTANTPQPVRPQAVKDKRVSTDASLNGSINVLAVNTGGNSAGYLQVQVAVQNTKPLAIGLAYRIDWLDDNGMLILTSPSLPRILQAKEISDIVAIAPTPRARDFRIQFFAASADQR